MGDIIEKYKRIIEGAKRGGSTTKRKYGREHFRVLARKSAEAKKARDPEYFRKLALKRWHKNGTNHRE